MDKLKNRIKYYLVGLLMGVIVVYFIFGNRGCAWLPGNRVKNMVGEKEIIAGDSIVAMMNKMDIDNDDVYDLLKTNGNVEFSLSITDSTPKVYHIKNDVQETSYWVNFAAYGNPNGEGLPEWKPYDEQDNFALIIDSLTISKRLPSLDKLRFWEFYYAEN